MANAATVSLIEAQGGNTVASSVTDAKGAFVLTFQNFTPVSGAPYTLEAVKGLAVGGKPNRPGAAAVRVRSLLFWNGGWQSLTNSVPGVGISVSPATTAIATIASLKLSARQNVDLTKLVGKVSGGTFDDSGTDLSRTADFDPVVRLVDNALTLDQDPVGAIAYDSVRGTYRLATGVPLGVGIEPAIPTPGQNLTIRGLNFDPTPGRQIFWFGNVPVTTWTVSPDRMAVTMTVPGSAFSAPLVLQQPGGVTVVIRPFLRLKGTAGTLAGGAGGGYLDANGQSARFNCLHGVVVARSGIVYTADRCNNRIRAIDPELNVTTLAGSGAAGFADGKGTAAQFNLPTQLALDAGDNLYVGDAFNNRVRKVAPDGTVTTAAGSGVLGFLDGSAAGAQFYWPHGVAVDAAGDLFVGDHINHRIRKVSRDGAVTTVAGGGEGFADGTGAAARFARPNGMVFAPNGDLIVADQVNNRVRRTSPSGQVTTVAGGAAGFAEGAAAAARFNTPTSLAVDGTGVVYVADLQNNRVRKIDGAGNVTTVAGDGTADSVDGPLTSARVNQPHGLAVDADGSLLVAEYGGRVRVITPP